MKIQSTNKLSSILKRWQLYSRMTNLGEIARRYFVMNFFDGVLTVLGIVIGYFILYIGGDTNISSSEIIIPSISVSIAIGISGISGGYLAEKAERQAELIEINMTMARPKEKTILNEEDYYPKIELKHQEVINKIDVDPVAKIVKASDKKIPKKEKTIAEKALAYATNVASLINGIAPFFGGVIGVIPIFFVPTANLGVFGAIFLVMIVTLFLLGMYLAKISDDNIWKYGLSMVSAGIITSIISIILTL